MDLIVIVSALILSPLSSLSFSSLPFSFHPPFMRCDNCILRFLDIMTVDPNKAFDGMRSDNDHIDVLTIAVPGDLGQVSMNEMIFRTASLYIVAESRW